MKALKVALATTMVIVLVAAACTSKANSAPAARTQIVAVQRGDLVVEITAAGNLAFSRWEDLAFQISGTQDEPLTVDEVKVEEGDSVKEGQVLVTLDTTALEKKVVTRERVATQAEVSVKNAEMSLTSAEIDLQTARDAEQNIASAQVALETATINFNRLNYPFNYATFAFDIPAAIENVRKARQQMESAQPGLEAGPGSASYTTALSEFRQAQYNMSQALERLAKGQDINVYDGTSVSSTVSNYLTARSTKIVMDDARIAVDKAKKSFDTGLEKARLSVDRAKVSLDQSKISLSVAREDLDEAKAEKGKATIVAPFTGFVAKINVKGGDEVRKGTVAVQVADPNRFEAEIMVNEMDIYQVKAEGKASVQANAISALTIPAKVTNISPTATIQSGVVNYKVKVELESLDSVLKQRLAAQLDGPPTGPGSAARTTRPPAPGGQSQTQQARQRQLAQQTPGSQTVPDNLQLRQGLTVTVGISVDQRTNALLVPNAAITRQGTQSTVKVSQGGVIEERVIKTGISNWQHTEVTEGLNEGEQVVVPQGVTAPTGSSATPKPPMGGIPGIGRMIR